MFVRLNPLVARAFSHRQQLTPRSSPQHSRRQAQASLYLSISICLSIYLLIYLSSPTLNDVGLLISQNKPISVQFSSGGYIIHSPHLGCRTEAHWDFYQFCLKSPSPRVCWDF